ncbi:MAG TPA: serine/threonine-protein kinase [Herpetosiphonaceae bacterium]|nr:serine/threonine-protein kinase [Herpetosiphonaceae bacterium]
MDIAQTSQPAAWIGRYQLVAEIGRGSTGIVYQAYDPLLERPLALKVLAPHVTHQPGMAQLLRREAVSAARLRHLNIALLYEFGQSGDSAFLAMEHIPGTSLRSLIGAGGLSIGRSLGILGQIGAALDYMHRVGVCHRDVKPGNIMIGPGDHAVLIDFGLAYAADGTASTAHGALLGTPTYLSPEQAAGEPSGPGSDQYALAVVAYELLTGSPPFTGRQPVALVHAHLYEAPDPPSERRPSLPPAVDAVLLRALSKRPRERYPSLAAFVAALGAALDRPLLGRRPAPAAGRWRRAAGLIAVGLALLGLLQRSGPAAAGPAAPPALAAAGVPLPEQIVWGYDSGLVGGAALSIAGDTLVTSSLDGALTALQAETGALLWQIPAAEASFGAPSAGAGLVFAGNNRGEVLARSLHSGGPIWQAAVVGDVREAPALAGDKVVVATSKGYVYVLQAANGAVVWSRPLALGARAAVVVAGRIFVSADRILYCLDLEHGTIVWQFSAASPITTLPSVAGDVVIVGTERGVLHGVSLATGYDRWQYQARGAFSAAPAADQSTLFVVDRAGGVTALSQAGGAELWHRGLGAAIDATPLLAGERLLVATGDGMFYALDAGRGQTLAEIQLGGSVASPPVAGSGLVYVRADQIYALGSSPK